MFYFFLGEWMAIPSTSAKLRTLLQRRLGDHGMVLSISSTVISISMIVEASLINSAAAGPMM